MRKILRAVEACTLLCGLATCADDDPSSIERHRTFRDAGAASADATSPPSGGEVTCYSAAAPTATCTAPAQCCFSNYSAQHDGACSTSTCAYGTISCDGPEDCASGQHCCSHALWGDDGLYGYSVACQAAACGDYEVCHPSSGCSNGGTCTSAYGTANDLPRTLYVCL